MSVLVSNNAVGELLVGISDVETALVLRSGQGSRFPAPITGKDWFYITIQDAQGNLETMKCTSRNVDTLVVTRSTDSARAFVADSVVELRPCAELFDDKADAVEFKTFVDDTTQTQVSTDATIVALTKRLNDAIARFDEAITALNTKDQQLTNSISDTNTALNDYKTAVSDTYVAKTEAESTYFKLSGGTISGAVTVIGELSTTGDLNATGDLSATGTIKAPMIRAATVRSSTVQSGVTYS